jgi:hypothetical protein
MSKYLQYAFVLICCLLSGVLFGGTPGQDDLTEKAYKLLRETIDQNRRNDLAGYSYRNNYVIEINLDQKWIEERGNGAKVFASKYESISQRLNEFNNKRADKLRAYVVVVNDWELRLKQHINIDLLPSTVKLDAIASQAEVNHAEEKKRIESELNQVPLDIYNKLKSAGYTDMAICFGANVKFYTVDKSGAPTARGYKYSTVVLSGEKLKANKEAIRSKIVSTSGATLENDVEMKVFSLTDGIEEVVDQQKPLTLAYKVSNPTVNNWYTSVGEKTTDPYSGVSTSKQVYDYTGVFSSLTNEIINQLPDPTAQVIITDNLTSDATIDNIKAQVAKPLAANVFWFHLDRKGELQTQLFLAQTVKERLGKLPNDIPTGLDQYIGKLYNEAGPKIKSPADLVDFLNINARVFKALNFVLDKATIPSSWWDASSPDYLLGVWGKYISPETGIAFAYVCGIWNGVIGNLSLVSGLLSLSSELQGVFIKILVDDGYRNQLFSDIKFYTTNIGVLIDIGYERIKAQASKAISEEWEKLKSGDVTGVAYVGGLATVEVVITIFTAGTVEAAKAGLMSFKLIRIPVEFISKWGSYLIRPAVIIFRAGGEIVMEGLEYVLKQGSEIVARVTADGKLVIYRMLSTTEKVVDEIPIPQSVVKMDGNGNAIGDIVFAKTETGWGFKKRSEFLEALSKSLANYPTLRDKVLTLTKDFQTKFIDDFLKNTEEDILKSLDASPTLVDGWKKLVDAPDAIKKNINYLEYVASWPSAWQISKAGDGMIITTGKGRSLGTLYSDRIVAPARTLSGEAGNALLNRVPLMKKQIYDVDNFIYQTDDLGRVVKANADLDDIVRIRLGNQQIRSIDVKDGVRGVDQGGHIIASRFYGPGEQINLYPMSATLNLSEWKAMENGWAQALVDGKNVKIEVNAIFSASSDRPARFRVIQDVDGEETIFNFIN